MEGMVAAEAATAVCMVVVFVFGVYLSCKKQQLLFMASFEFLYFILTAFLQLTHHTAVAFPFKWLRHTRNDTVRHILAKTNER